MRLSPAELADERTRHQHEFWWYFLFTIGFGIALYLLVAWVTARFRGLQHNHDLLRSIDLGMPPTEGIAVVSPMLAVVVALNIALAAQQVPPDAKERIRAAEWQLYLAFISMLSASGAVCVTLMCWFSGDRGHSTGSSIGLGFTALLAVALSAAQRLKATTAEAAAVNRYLRESRLIARIKAREEFQQRYPGLTVSRGAIVGRYLYGAIVLGILSTVAALGIAGIERRFIGWPNLIWLGLIGIVLEACLLFAGKQIRILRLGRYVYDRFAAYFSLACQLCIPVTFPLMLLFPLATWLRVTIAGYCVTIWALAVGSFMLERSHPRLGLTSGARAAVGLTLNRVAAEAERELIKTRDRDAAATQDRSQNRVSGSSRAAPRRPHRRRRPRPAGRRSRPA